MKGIQVDAKVVNDTINAIETIMDRDRTVIDTLITKYKDVSSFDKLNKGKDLLRVYGDAADDYAKVCYIQTGVAEALLDLKTVKKEMTDNTSIMPSIVKNYKYRIDYLVEQLTTFKEAVLSTKQALEAKVRYYNTVSYTSYEKMMGPKC